MKPSFRYAKTLNVHALLATLIVGIVTAAHATEDAIVASQWRGTGRVSRRMTMGMCRAWPIGYSWWRVRGRTFATPILRSWRFSWPQVGQVIGR